MPEATQTITVEIREVQPQRYLGLKLGARLDAIGPKVQAGFEAIYARLAATSNPPAGPPFLIAQQPRDGQIDVELGAPCVQVAEPGEGFESGTLPGGRVAVTIHRGDYDALGSVYQSLARWIADHKLAMAGPPREVYLSPPGQQPVTEVVWPISENG